MISAKRRDQLKVAGLFLMAAFYAFTGVSHLLDPDIFVKAIPPILPFPYAIAVLSGVAELVLAVTLLFVKTRRWAAWGVIALLIAVFPANIHMYLARETEFPDIPGWALLLRLPMQFILIGWAYFYTRPSARALDRANTR